MGKDSYYFSHDSNASMDPRILKLRVAHGWEGYGVFWAIIESMRNQEDYKLSVDEVDFLTLSLAIDLALLQQILSKCLEVGLFVKNDGKIYSESLLRRMKKADEIREKRRSAGSKGGKAKANAKQMLEKAPSKTVALKETKVNEGKDKKSKEKKDERSLAFASCIKEINNGSTILSKVEETKFIDYWTESNSGENTKLRFECQKIFDEKKRLITWAGRVKDNPDEKKTGQKAPYVAPGHDGSFVAPSKEPEHEAATAEEIAEALNGLE